mgnify:FL=1
MTIRDVSAKCIHGNSGYCYVCVWTQATGEGITLGVSSVTTIRETFERIAADADALRQRAEKAEAEAAERLHRYLAEHERGDAARAALAKAHEALRYVDLHPNAGVVREQRDEVLRLARIVLADPTGQAALAEQRAMERVVEAADAMRQQMVTDCETAEVPVLAVKPLDDALAALDALRSGK